MSTSNSTNKYDSFPLISFVIPMYNAEKYLDRCLISITKQDYPKDKIEILCIDGGSTDKTIKIARKYNVKILPNPRKIAEFGKSIGIKESKGKYFILLDTDNEIVEKDWLQKMVHVITDSPDLFGVESALSHDKSLSSLNRYFARMRIADPLARCLASKPIVEKRDGYDILKFKPSDILITGANGFIWNKKLVMENTGWEDKFEEANFSTYIHGKTGANYAIPHNASVRHYYCDSLGDYIKKRRKVALKMRGRIENRQNDTWIKKVSRFRLIWSIFYLGTVIGPSVETFYESIKARNIDWFWHPLISFLTIMIYIYNFIF